jgi:hypothetical protein
MESFRLEISSQKNVVELQVKSVIPLFTPFFFCLFGADGCLPYVHVRACTDVHICPYLNHTFQNCQMKLFLQYCVLTIGIIMDL